ncbi:MAG: hypothetical protein OEU92_24460 [Alphaproteobacteria bacterium]|nr:hypothetical protein [Alphaproteobacteria bacterium]
MIKSPTPILCFCVATLLGGCTTDDPNQGGLLGGLIGLGSGAYEERVADETAALRAEEIRYREEIDDKEGLDRALRESRAQAFDLKDQLASIRREVDGLEAEITVLQRDETVTRDEVEKAEADVATLLDDIDRIEAEREAHEQARALGADAEPDTDPAEFGEPPREQVSDLRAYIIELQQAVDALKATRAKRAGEVATPPVAGTAD